MSLRSIVNSLVVIALADVVIVVTGQCPKKDIKCKYPVLKEFDQSGSQLLGHASCLRKECDNLLDDDHGESKDVVLRLHNELRQKIARGKPTGRLWRHDQLKCRSTDQFMYVGQNIFWVHDDHGTMNWKHAIGAWYNQLHNMNDNFVEHPPGLHTNVSEFIQLIWAHSFKVGCGYLKATFDNPVDPAHRYVQSFYICNYGPQGNRPWIYTYRVGRAASNCPQGSLPSKEYMGLCKVYDEDIVRQNNGNY
ncbi:venom allergen 5-like [Tropilaelaps mercedesae]|uniref:Venom allergen 5-like n=1 Tax=Tropilaelaps mercedesae TaxID=418985 RepID=A0A1V9X522_9ACAR|nr:venom allergen 5-like [Tropilaelaps mercedesae]